MKLHLHHDATANLISSYEIDHVIIRQQTYRDNLIVTADEIVIGWAAQGYAGLTNDDFVAILRLNPSVVLLATGSRQRFPPPALLQPLIDANIGCEIMEISAACRTYNLLVSEKRAVALALLFDDIPAP